MFTLEIREYNVSKLDIKIFQRAYLVTSIGPYFVPQLTRCQLLQRSHLNIN